MPKFDTLTGKYSSEFYFYDQYGALYGPGRNEEVQHETSPVFSSLRDAEMAEEMAFNVFLQVLRVKGVFGAA